MVAGDLQAISPTAGSSGTLSFLPTSAAVPLLGDSNRSCALNTSLPFHLLGSPVDRIVTCPKFEQHWLPVF